MLFTYVINDLGESLGLSRNAFQMSRFEEKGRVAEKEREVCVIIFNNIGNDEIHIVFSEEDHAQSRCVC